MLFKSFPIARAHAAFARLLIATFHLVFAPAIPTGHTVKLVGIVVDICLAGRPWKFQPTANVTVMPSIAFSVTARTR